MSHDAANELATKSTGGFPHDVKVRALVACKRHCCLCERPMGVKMHCHHILPKARSGDDSFDNCIPLCLNCHAEVEAYNDQHPMGNKYRPEELRRRRDQWYEGMANPKVHATAPQGTAVDRETLADIQSVLPSSGNIEFIRTFTFGFSFRREDIEQIETFYYERNGPEHEFVDDEIESQRKELRKRIGRFLKLIGANTFVQASGRLAVPDEWEMSQGSRYFKALDDLGAAADEVCDAYDAFIRAARRRLLS